MYDRLPAPGKENRVRITQDDGKIVEGVLSYADGATVQGSAYCKANVLPDEVCDALGIDRVTAEPKDALTALKNSLTSGLASKAPINSPALTGSPTAPTPVEGDKTTKIATTAFVQSAIIKQIRGSVSAGSYDTTITLGVKPFLVILYSNSNNDHNTMFQSSAAYLYDTPRIITDLYSGTAGSIISTGFTISRAGTEKTIYYVALYI